MNWRVADKQLGCWIFCHGVVGFVFKFGSNWMNFDVFTPFLMGRQGWCSVRARKVSKMVSGPTSLSLTLIEFGEWFDSKMNNTIWIYRIA